MENNNTDFQDAMHVLKQRCQEMPHIQLST